MEFLLIASAHFMALLSPGPDFFLILQTAIRLPFRYTSALCLGIAVANGLYLCCAVGALGVVREMVWLMNMLKYIGGAYLLYLGILLLKAPVQSLSDQATGPFLFEKKRSRQFVVGFMSALLNPKNILFYFSLFTVMVSPKTSLQVRVLYGLWMVSVVLVWDLFLAAVLGNVAIKKWLGRWLFVVEKIAGCMLALFGILLTVQ